MDKPTLLKLINEDFDIRSVERGNKYYMQGRVSNVTSVNEDDYFHLEAKVRGSGSKRYKVSVQVAEGIIDSSCTCPVYAQCKHAVAVCLEAEELGYLRPKKAMTSNEVGVFDSWLKKLETGSALAQKPEQASKAQEMLFFVLKEGPFGLCFEVRLCMPLNGGWSQGRALSGSDIYLRTIHQRHKNDPDHELLSTLAQRPESFSSQFTLSDQLNAYVFHALIATKRCVWNSVSSQCFVISPPQRLEFHWQKNERYELRTNFDNDSENRLVLSANPYVLNLKNRTCSLVESPLPMSMVRHLWTMPGMAAADAMKFVEWVHDNELSLPVPFNSIETELGKLQPVMQLDIEEGECLATLVFKYGVVETPFNPSSEADLILEHEGNVRKVTRDEAAENRALTELEQLGILPRYKLVQRLYDDEFYGNVSVHDFFDIDPAELVPDSDEVDMFWLTFDQQVRPLLEQKGWLIRQNATLPKLIDIHSVHGTVSGEFNGWFELGLEVVIDGKTVNLVQVLQRVLPMLGDWELQQENIFVPYGDDYISLKTEHIKPVLRILQQMTDDKQRVPKHHVSILNDLPFVDKWSGDKKLRDLAQQLKNFSGITERKLPRALKAELRDYQKAGFDWLGFLHQYGFGGILADDMGLGKTVQTLTHLLALKQSRKLTNPAMVICPTSLVHNWRSEAEKFTPTLKVLVLHGPDRFDSFGLMKDCDLVITTYPLIVRDIEQLEQQPLSILILDEAQAIKNSKTKMAKMVRTLNAENRVCLSGTPLENHLGELWSQFDFLMPGYLGSLLQFKEFYQKPIESGDREAQQWLNKRIAPFMLRRTKDEVATELPEKTEIIQTIDMQPAQRKVYESIRSVMEKKVRELIKQQGIAKSQIEFLDALLKLRQACCHTQLVKLEEVKKIDASAKLDFLLDVLPELIEEGRRILIFSQFAKMLGIIEKALQGVGISTTKLTGQTRKREQVIEAFKSGSASVFLISLKAGGTGLNLTEADTVIHFDPWWNPAAEQQATDRAHRIGQDKPVFVYKLVAENSIEEKVLELQKRKQAMASAIYEASAEAPLSKLNSEQMLELFQ